MTKGQPCTDMEKHGRGTPQIPTVLRLCLAPSCDRMFPSTGPGHRICDRHKTNGYVPSVPEGWEMMP